MGKEEEDREGSEEELREGGAGLVAGERKVGVVVVVAFGNVLWALWRL